MNSPENFFAAPRKDNGDENYLPDGQPEPAKSPVTPDINHDHPAIPSEEIQKIIDDITKEEQEDDDRARRIDEGKQPKNALH